MSSPLLAQQKSAAVFDSYEWDFGQLNAAYGSVCHTFKMKNTSKTGISIAKAVNTAGEPCPAGATAICGIGDPDRFREDLAAVGIAPARIVKLPDHSKNFERSLLQIIRGGSQAVITEKDAARLGRELRQNPAVFAAYQEVSVSSSAFEAISALFSK